jgi:ankyrin repeat protein
VYYDWEYAKFKAQVQHFPEAIYGVFHTEVQADRFALYGNEFLRAPLSSSSSSSSSPFKSLSPAEPAGALDSLDADPHIQESRIDAPPPLMQLMPRRRSPEAITKMSKQAYELCKKQDTSGLRAFLETHSSDIDLYLYEQKEHNTRTFNIMGLAAHHYSAECLQVLIDFGADVDNQERVNGVSPLMRAAHFGRVKCVRLLLENNADVALASIEGDTALHRASSKGHLECLRLLLENSADVDYKTKDGHTGLIMATDGGHTECVEVLMEAKADVDCKDVDGRTAFTLAIERKFFDCLMLLLDRSDSGTPVSAATKANALRTALEREGEFSASERAMAFMMLAHGADIDVAAMGISNNARLRPTASMYANTHLFIERWHGVASNALSMRVEVDRRVSLGLIGLYHEPLERVLQYLGLSTKADQVVNSSLDDDDGVRRVLLPNCAQNANHWFQQFQKAKEKAIAARSAAAATR